MPAPTFGIQTQDPILTGHALGVKNDNLIGEKVCPMVPVGLAGDGGALLSGQFPIFDDNFIFQIASANRSPGTRANQIGRQIRWYQFNCSEDSLEFPITDEDRRRNQTGVDLDRFGTTSVTDQILLNHEAKVAALYCDSGTLTQYETISAANQFNNYSNGNADPRPYVEAARQVILKATGFEPNSLIIAQSVWSVLKFHPALQNMFFNQGRQQVSEEQAKTIFAIENIYIGKSVATFNNYAQATQTRKFIWGNNMVLAYIDPGAIASPDGKRPTLGMTFRSGGMVADTWYEQPVKTTFVRSGQYLDVKVPLPAAGYLFQNCINAALVN